MPWSVYLKIHKTLYDLVKETGVTDLSAFIDVSYARAQLPELCNEGLNCAESGSCDVFEEKMADLINTNLKPNQKVKALAAFPFLGNARSEGSASFLVSKGKNLIETDVM